jgi:hypothetical protein
MDGYGFTINVVVVVVLALIGEFLHGWHDSFDAEP